MNLLIDFYFSDVDPEKLYALSYYDSVLREMVKLVTMESKHENSIVSSF